MLAMPDCHAEAVPYGQQPLIHNLAGPLNPVLSTWRGLSIGSVFLFPIALSFIYIVGQVSLSISQSIYHLHPTHLTTIPSSISLHSTLLAEGSYV